MPFVKLDCGILNSTLWFERECREVFLTALLMAEPFELKEPTPQIAIGSLEFTGWVVPAGWYGFVPAASVGILHRAKVADDVGMAALKRLGEPEVSSRSPEFDGRRLVRIDGGFLVLNYIKYRERDYTAAERSKRYRDRLASRRSVNTSRRNITQAEVEVEAEAEAEAEEKNVRTREAAAGTIQPFDVWLRELEVLYPSKAVTRSHLTETAFVSVFRGDSRPSVEVWAEMLSNLENQKAGAQWAKGMIPKMEKWLREGLWRQRHESGAVGTSAATAGNAAALRKFVERHS